MSEESTRNQTPIVVSSYKTKRQRDVIIWSTLAVFLLILFSLFPEVCSNDNAKNVAYENTQYRYIVCSGQPGNVGVKDFFKLPPLDIESGGCYGTIGKVEDGGMLTYSYAIDRMNASRNDEGVIRFRCPRKDYCNIFWESVLSGGKYRSNGTGEIRLVVYSDKTWEWRGVIKIVNSDIQKNVGRYARVVIRDKRARF